MLKRLIVAGLPCPAETWENFLGRQRGQRVLTFREILENSRSADPRELAVHVATVLNRERPQSIVGHDIGVPLTLMALLRLRRRGIQWKTRLTLFNGAFRQVSLWKANHPLRAQLMTEKQLIREVEKNGGAVDHALHEYLPRIRAMYRYVILYRVSEKLTSFLGLDDFAGFPSKSRLPFPVQIIASRNDPFLPFESIERLRRDLRVNDLVEVDYGHFPYSIDPDRIVPHLEAFEAEGEPRAARRARPSV
jgi:pimeloyl-ACP methyl ester carboxylesterase